MVLVDEPVIQHVVGKCEDRRDIKVRGYPEHRETDGPRNENWCGRGQ